MAIRPSLRTLLFRPVIPFVRFRYSPGLNGLVLCIWLMRLSQYKASIFDMDKILNSKGRRQGQAIVGSERLEGWVWVEREVWCWIPGKGQGGKGQAERGKRKGEGSELLMAGI